MQAGGAVHGPPILPVLFAYRNEPDFLYSLLAFGRHDVVDEWFYEFLRMSHVIVVKWSYDRVAAVLGVFYGRFGIVLSAIV